MSTAKNTDNGAADQVIDPGPFHVRCTDGRQGNVSHAARASALADAARRNHRELVIGGEVDAEWFVAVSVEKDRLGWRRAVLGEPAQEA